jgi:hypothetical protein
MLSTHELNEMAKSRNRLLKPCLNEYVVLENVAGFERQVISLELI